MFRTILVEDDIQIHRRIKDLLQRLPNIRLLQGFHTLSDAMMFCKGNKVDLAILDIGLPDGKGTELIHFLNRRQPDSMKLMLTIYDDYNTFMNTMEMGIDGYIVKTASNEEIRQGIEYITNGHAYISPEVARYVLKKHRKTSDNQHDLVWLSELSQREVEVLKLLSVGLSYACIGAKLNIKYNTVCSHIKNIYYKLDVSSKNEAIYVGIRSGLVSIEDSIASAS